jgi:hypothetical protein
MSSFQKLSAALNMRRAPGMVVGNTIQVKGGKLVSNGYPEDVEDAVAKGAGKFQITVRVES